MYQLIPSMILYIGLPILTHCYREFVIFSSSAYGSDSMVERRDARQRALQPSLLFSAVSAAQLGQAAQPQCQEAWL